MSDKEAVEQKFKTAAGLISSAGMVPFAVTDTLLEIVRFYLDEADADFVNAAFDGAKSLSLDQLKEKTGLDEEAIKARTASLAKKGILFNQPNTRGVMIYRLLPLILVGAFEYTFMNRLPEGKERAPLEKIAKLYHTLLKELRDNMQRSYDNLLPIFEQQPPVDRTVPTFTTETGSTININKTIHAEDTVLPAQTVEEIVNKFDDIAVGHCFCRNYNKVLGHDCEEESIKPDDKNIICQYWFLD